MLAVLLLAAGGAYGIGLLAARRRGRSWPAWRALSFAAGLAVAAAATAPTHDFTGHMYGHLLLGMVAPLLLVLAAPGTLALRALPVRGARRWSRLAASRAVRVPAHPLTAVALGAGGLWLLYTTGLHSAAAHSPVLGPLVQAHVLTAGVLLVNAVAGVDPAPHRAGRPMRAAALLIFMAAHAVLAKHLYAHPPAGVPAADGRAGAQLMYYGGDLADLVLLTIFCWQWYDPARFRVAARRAPRPWRLPAGV